MYRSILGARKIAMISLRRLMSVKSGALDDVKVLDLTRIAAGPYCSMILGDLGATIYKVEAVGSGDETRNWPPNVNNSDGENSCYFSSLNRNKKSVCVDFKSKDGLRIVHKLASQCDVVIENFVPGKLDQIDLGYDALKQLSPGLIYCSITGYGSRGPYKNRPGYDNIAGSIGGLFHISGPRNGDPCKAGVALTDLATGLYAHGAILAALYHRLKTGMGQKIDVNLLSTQVACLINIGSNYLNTGKEAVRWGTQHESIVPYQAFSTKDGFVTLCSGSDLQFRSLCQILNLHHLSEDERFETNKSRVKHRDVLLPIIESVISTKTTKEVLEILDGAPFPYGPVNNMEQVFNDPHIQAIGLVEEMTMDTGTSVKVVGPPVEYSGMTNSTKSPPPSKGQHTREVLSKILGYSSVEINRFYEEREVRAIKVTLKKPKCDKQVKWTTETVDNEHLNKKKSKCCCIYEKPRNFGESSSEDEGECENCFGHVELKKKDTPPSDS